MDTLSCVPAGTRTKGAGMSGDLPGSENASTGIGGRLLLYVQRLVFASSVTVRTPVCRTPTDAVFGLLRTSDGAERVLVRAAAITVQSTQSMISGEIRRVNNFWLMAISSSATIKNVFRLQELNK